MVRHNIVEYLILSAMSCNEIPVRRILCLSLSDSSCCVSLSHQILISLYVLKIMMIVLDFMDVITSASLTLKAGSSVNAILGTIFSKMDTHAEVR